MKNFYSLKLSHFQTHIKSRLNSSNGINFKMYKFGNLKMEKHTKKQSVLHLIHHFIIGGILIIKGYDKFHHHPVLGSIIFLFGVIILGYCFWTLSGKKHNPVLPVLFHLFEAFVMLFTAYIFFTEGKKYLPYVSILASVGFLISVFVLYKRYKIRN